MHLIWWRKAVNDNSHSRYDIVESPSLNQFAVVEYDRLGPILRLGPYASRHHALDRLAALVGMIAERGLEVGAAQGAARP